MMGRCVVIAAVLAIMPVATASLACEGPNIQYEDDYSVADPAWGNYTGQKIEGGKLTIAPEQNAGYALENQIGFFEDADVCVDVVQKNNDPTTGYAGILFWGTDYDNFYTFDVATNGYIRVSRKQNTRWLTPVSWTLIQGVNPGTAVNQIRVTLKGNRAKLYVNGTLAGQFRGQPPQGGSLVGVYASSPRDSTGLYDFDNFKVTDVADEADAPPAQPTPPAEPDVPPSEPDPAEPVEPEVPAVPKPGTPGAPKIPG